MSSKKTTLKNRFSSLRIRLTLFFVGLLGVTLITFSLFLYRSFVKDQRNEFDTALYNYATDISRSIDVTFFGTLTVEMDVLFDRGKIFPFLVGQSFIQIIDKNGKVLARSSALKEEILPIFEEDLQEAFLKKSAFRTVKSLQLPSDQKNSNSKPQAYRLITYPIKRGNSINLVLQVAVPQILLTQQTQRLLNFFLIGIPFTLLLVSLGGFYLAGQAIAPVSGIIEIAKGIGVQSLSERVPVPDVHDEMRDLATTLNGLLDRLELAFDSQERFIADASHQLRTPLAILRGELDVLKSRNRSKEELLEFIQSASVELTHLSQMVNDLLTLARVDAGTDSLELEEVRVDELMLDAVSRLQPWAKDKGIKIRLDLQGDDFTLRGDSDLLQTMLQCLIENAIKYSTQGKAVEVTVDSTKQTTLFFVRNWGQVIPQDQLKEIFKRFYQYESQTTSKMRGQGLGLGLALAQRIVEAHSGLIWAKSSISQGTTFGVEFKKTADFPKEIKKV